MDKVDKVKAAGEMRRFGAGILLLVLLCCLLGGCSIEKVRAGDGVKPEYTVMKEEDFPEKVKELINENKEEEFQMTYQDQGYLYLLKGYGKQETGGYSIQIEEVCETEDAVCIRTCLTGPDEGEKVSQEPDCPYATVATEYTEKRILWER